MFLRQCFAILAMFSCGGGVIFLWRGCMIFFVERLRAFFVKRLHDFVLVERLRDLFS